MSHVYQLTSLKSRDMTCMVEVVGWEVFQGVIYSWDLKLLVKYVEYEPTLYEAALRDNLREPVKNICLLERPQDIEKASREGVVLPLNAHVSHFFQCWTIIAQLRMEAALFVPSGRAHENQREGQQVFLCNVQINDATGTFDSVKRICLYVAQYIRPLPVPSDAWKVVSLELPPSAPSSDREHFNRYVLSLSQSLSPKAGIVEVSCDDAVAVSTAYILYDSTRGLILSIPPTTTVAGEKRKRETFEHEIRDINEISPTPKRHVHLPDQTTLDVLGVAGIDSRNITTAQAPMPHEHTGIGIGLAHPIEETSASGSAGSEAHAEGVKILSADSTPSLPNFDDSQEDIPPLALLRQECLLAHRRCLALALAPAAPFPGAHKTSRACKEMGLLSGLQGLHQRWLFQQQLAECQHVDPLLPFVTVDALDKQVMLEMEACGISSVVAKAALTSLNYAMNDACKLLVDAASQLRAGLPHDWSDSTFGLSIHITASGCVAISYSPRADALRWLQQVSQLFAVPEHYRRVLGTAENIFASNTVDVVGPSAPPFTSTVVINANHYRKLHLLYAMAAAGVNDPQLLPEHMLRANGVHADNKLMPDELEPLGPRFLTRLFCVLARYEALSSTASGMQGAVPHEVFDLLETLGVSHECFASPLNCHFPSFCSLFPDTDRFFGSKGNFFSFAPTSGAFESNPPFVNKILLENVSALDSRDGGAPQLVAYPSVDSLQAKHIVALLESATGPMTFVLFTPAWGDAYYHEFTTSSRFCRSWQTLKKKEHYYIDGMQHRATRAVWSANVDSFVYILSTEQENSAVSFTKIMNAMAVTPVAVDAKAANRVMKFDVTKYCISSSAR